LFESFSSYDYRTTHPRWFELVEIRLEEDFLPASEASKINQDVELMLAYLQETVEMYRISSEYYDRITELQERIDKSNE